MVTRRPIELTLIHTPRTASEPNPIEFAEFPSEHSGHITDFSVVQSRLTDLNLSVPASEAVSPDPIQLRIHSPNVPDLSLVDLPGYVQISSMDQPEELKHKITDLCDKYIRANNIILAVCSADVDLANSPALRASRKVDPLGLRTIGVITKMDLVAPQIGSDVLANERYPLSLGYVGVVCKAVGVKEAEHQKESNSLFKFGSAKEGPNFDLMKPVQRQENAFFGSNAEHFNKPGMQVGTNTLKRRLMEVLEESMGGSLHSISNAVAMELEEASYQFKVQYNDRSISAESYFAETMDSLKSKFASLSKVFGKPEARKMLRAAMEEKVTDTLAKMYWIDPRLAELSKFAADTRNVPTPEDLEPYWQHKLEASASAVTKSGVGRSSTQLIVDALRNQVSKLAEMEPFIHHPAAAEGIAALSDAILHNRFAATAEQVENSVKPFKKEVEVDEAQWEAGRQRGQFLLERELGQCDSAFKKISDVVGGRKLKSAMDFVRDLEERERKRISRRSSVLRGEALAEPEEEDNDPNRPVYNPNLLAKAREASFLASRSDVLKLRIAALKAKRCKAGPENQAFCPEAFLNAVAAQLTYTAIQHINIELLGEFFYLFPREIDSRYDLHKQEITDFARQNPDIRKHLDLQERKEKLELVMGKLDSLVKLQQEKTGGHRQPQRRGLFGLGLY